jgi:murein L,D-transpeptidase YcbB/YkuD
MTMLSKLLGKLRNPIAGSLTVMIMAGIALATLPLPAYADEGTPPAPADGSTGKALNRIYQRELTVLGNQTDRLGRISEIITKVQDLIDEVASQGKDVAPLEQALATFQTQVASAQSEHDQANSILQSHQGFTADGQVTDRAQALLTVRQAAQALRDCHRTLVQAVGDLRMALRQWRRDNLSQPTTAAGIQL